MSSNVGHVIITFTLLSFLALLVIFPWHHHLPSFYCCNGTSGISVMFIHCLGLGACWGGMLEMGMWLYQAPLLTLFFTSFIAYLYDFALLFFDLLWTSQRLTHDNHYSEQEPLSPFTYIALFDLFVPQLFSFMLRYSSFFLFFGHRLIVLSLDSYILHLGTLIYLSHSLLCWDTYVLHLDFNIWDLLGGCGSGVDNSKHLQIMCMSCGIISISKSAHTRGDHLSSIFYFYNT